LASHLGRRKFLATLAGAAAAWPLATRAQQPAMPVIGFLRPGSPESVAHLLIAFRAGLREEGFVEGQNVTIEYRWTEGQDDRLPKLLDDLVQRQVALIVTPGSTTFAFAAKAATKTIPIAFTSGIDPVKSGLVASFNKPGGNVTGIYQLANDLTAKRFELLHELVPSVTVFAALVNPTNAIVAETTTNEFRATASVLGLEVKILEASSNREIDMAFSSLFQQRVGAMLVSSDPYFTSRRVQFATLTNRTGIPAMFSIREYVEVGGLMSYGNNIAHSWRRLGFYAGRILKGEKGLPVDQSTKFEFVINLQTAKALGLEVPPTLLARADEVIE
jgi:putative tryptophan/tyrosine transport system substrate-binding protein